MDRLKPPNANGSMVKSSTSARLAARPWTFLGGLITRCSTLTSRPEDVRRFRSVLEVGAGIGKPDRADAGDLARVLTGDHERCRQRQLPARIAVRVRQIDEDAAVVALKVI